MSSVRSLPSHLDASPPVYQGPADQLDRGFFTKSVTVLAAKVQAEKTGMLLKSPVLSRSIINLPKIKSVVKDSGLAESDRLLLLRVQNIADLDHEAHAFLSSLNAEFVQHKLNLDYEYWSADDILRSILPEKLLLKEGGTPTAFALTGHIAHVNLNDDFLPYKHVIGQVLLDKNFGVRTVVNKLGNINAQFRFFDMELLAGEPEFVVTHSEHDCLFTFDFSKVYWNSRLQNEHRRLVDLFRPDDLIADVFAGVGPFALPAAVKGCAVMANDLNPNSAEFLTLNAINNRVSPLVRVSCADGREFIRSAALKAYEEPFPSSRPRASRRATNRGASNKAAIAPESPETSSRRKISHYLMNLPDTAILFLDAFRGVFATDPLKEFYNTGPLPMVHCHCFTRELEPGKAESDIRARVQESIGSPLEDEVSLHWVRSVAPNKYMYCISFRLPRAVVFV